MAESFEQYRKRVLAYLGRRDPLRIQAATPLRLKRLTAGLPRRALTRRPAPGKWSIVEIVAHMADAELAMAWRLRNILANPGVRLPWWDEHAWSIRLGYAKVPVARSLSAFRSLRAGNLALLRSTPRRRWSTCFGRHDKRGRQTVADFVRMEAAHDLNHLRQVEAIVRDSGPRRSPRAR
jgi:hypothetical protein